MSTEVVACAVAALSRKGSRKRKKASEKAVPVTTAAPVVMGDDEDMLVREPGHYVKTEGSLAERARALAARGG